MFSLVFNIILFQFADRLLYAPHSLANIFVTRGITQAQSARLAERLAGHGGHVGLFEQVHSEVGGVVDGALAIAFAEEVVALGEKVESPLGHVHLKPGDVLG